MEYEEFFREIKEKYNKRELIGELLFDYFDDNNFEADIYNFAAPEIFAYINFNTSEYKHPEYIFTALTLIALKYYDGGFWDNVCDKFAKAKGKMNDVVFQNKLREFLREYKNFFDNSRLIDLPVIHSIIPFNFMYDYFVFCYDIYVYNLRCSLRDFDVSDLKFVFDSLHKQISSSDNSDTLNIHGLKTYKLKQSTKKIITSQYGLNSLINLTQKIIKIIDNFYWDKEQFDMSSYFSVAYNKWIKNISQEEKKKGVSEAKKRTEFVKWVPKFVFKNNSVYLETREDMISDIYEKSSLAMEIYNGNDLIEKRINLHANDMIGGYRLESERFEIRNPLNRISYKLKSNDSIIYDSNDNLHRDFLLFNNNGYEVKNHSDHNDEIITFVLNKNEILNDCNQVVEKKNYNIWFQHVYSNLQYPLSNCLIDFISTPNSGIYGNIAKNAYFKYDVNNKIYNKVHQVVFVIKEDPKMVILVINNKKYHLDENFVRVTKNNNFSYVAIDFSNFKNDYYNVYLQLLGNKKPLSNTEFNFVIDNDFKVYTKFESGYKFVVSSSIYETEEFDFKLTDHWEEPLFFDYDSYNDLPIILTFDRPIYKINKQWYTFDNFIWKDDLIKEKEIALAGVAIKQIQILDENKRVFVDKMNIKRIVGQAIISTSSFKSIFSKSIYLNVIDDEDNQYCVRIVKDLIFEDLKIDYSSNGNSLIITPNYLGKNEITINIKSENYAKEFKIQNSGNELILRDINSFSPYDISINYFNMSAFKNILLFEGRYVYYDMDKLNGSIFMIKGSRSYFYRNNEQFEKFNKIINTYLQVKDKLSSGTYRVLLFSKHVDNNGKTSGDLYKKLRDQKIEFVTRIDEYGFCKAVIFSEDDLVLYDPKNKSIYNGDHKELLPIDEFDLEFVRRV